MDVSEKKSIPQEEDDDYLAPIVSSYNDELLRSIVDRLCAVQQCIQPPTVPTIVLVGDRRSGKSSLVASLIGIKFPRFCTRLPVLIKLQNDQSPKLEFSIEFDGKERSHCADHDNDEWSVALEIARATNLIAGGHSESFKESESAEATLFELVLIDKTSVGVPFLARTLKLIQAKITSIDITRKIKDRNFANVSDLNKLPRQCFCSVANALRAVMRFLSEAKKSSQAYLHQLDEVCQITSARTVVEMLDQYSAQLHSMINLQKNKQGLFLMDEIRYIEERKVNNGLPNDDFLNEKVGGISKMAEDFVGKMWNYIEEVVVQVLIQHFDSHMQLHDSTIRAVQNMIANKKKKG